MVVTSRTRVKACSVLWTDGVRSVLTASTLIFAIVIHLHPAEVLAAPMLSITASPSFRSVLEGEPGVFDWTVKNVAGSENSDQILSGDSDHLPVALPGQKIVGHSASDEGKHGGR